MTPREEQILGWIREDPLISQQELASRAGITRSSVSVHIANLTRKGLLRGRGYLLGEEGYIAVVGAVNVDISGTPETTLLPGDSNPGHVRITMGGVGRNIAENLCRLGRRVMMVTALGEDANAQTMRQSCREIGIDLTHSLTVPQGRTSTYLCLNDEQGEIVGAVSDMEIYDAITPAWLETKLDVLNHAQMVIADCNLSEAALAFLAERVTVPLAADPVSVKKAVHLRGALHNLVFFKPNRPEASLLSGVEIRTHDDLPLASKALRECGVKNVFISLGGEGVYFDDGTESGILPCVPGPIHNTNGCGDAFLASAASSWLDGHSLKNCALRGLAASSLCARSESAVSPLVTPENIAELVKCKED